MKKAYIRRTLLKHKSPVQLRGWWGEAKGDHDLRSLTFNALPKKRDWNISWSGIKAWWLVKKSETWPFPRSRGRKGRPYRSRKKVSSQDWQTRARIRPFSMDIDFQKLEWLEGSEKRDIIARRLRIQFPKTSDTLQMTVCAEMRKRGGLFWKV